MSEKLVAVQMNGETIFVTEEEKEKIFKKTLKAVEKIGKLKYYGDAFKQYMPRTPEGNVSTVLNKCEC